MAHGNEVRSLLGSHHTCDLGNGQDIALGNLASLNLFKSFGLKKNCGLCRSGSLGRVLGTEIDHPRPPRLVEVRKFCHFAS